MGIRHLTRALQVLAPIHAEKNQQGYHALYFFKYKYLSNPTVTPADAILTTAQDMVACLKGHMARHLGAKKLRDVGKLQIIFSKAANQIDATTNPATKKNTKWIVVSPRAR